LAIETSGLGRGGMVGFIGEKKELELTATLNLKKKSRGWLFLKKGEGKTRTRKTGSDADRP